MAHHFDDQALELVQFVQGENIILGINKWSACASLP